MLIATCGMFPNSRISWFTLVYKVLCLHDSFLLFQDPDAEETNEETGRVVMVYGSSYLCRVELGMQTLKFRRRDWKPKGNCWLWAKIDYKAHQNHNRIGQVTNDDL